MPKFRALAFLTVTILHGGLLLLPAPQWWQTPLPEPEPEPILEESGEVALTTLPKVAAPVTAPVAEPEPAAPVEPPPERLPVQPEIADAIESEPAEPEPQDQEPEFDEQEPEPENSEPEAGFAVRFSDDFPHVTGATSGCYGLDNCRTVDGQNFRDIAKALQQQLETQGYKLTPYDNGDSGGGNHRVYEMRSLSAPESAVKYLNIFGEGLTGAFYIITPALIDRQDMEALALN